MNEKPKVSHYKDLLVWQQSMEIVRTIYALTACFPEHEKFGLTSQIRRASVSVVSNIAEGFGRDSIKDYLRHLSISAGSLSEVEAQLEVAIMLSYTNRSSCSETLELIVKTMRMLRNLQKSLKAKV